MENKRQIKRRDLLIYLFFHRTTLLQKLFYEIIKRKVIKKGEVTSMLNYIGLSCVSMFMEFGDFIEWHSFVPHMLPEDFIKKYRKHLNFDNLEIINNPLVSDEYIIELIDKGEIGLYMCLPTLYIPRGEVFLEKYWNKFNKRVIYTHVMLSEEFLLKHAAKDRCWIQISQYQNIHLYPLFLEESKDNIKWSLLCQYHRLSRDVIRQYKDYVDWYMVSKNQVLSEEFIEEFQDKVDWDAISHYQYFSEFFIKRFQDKLNWHYISGKQVHYSPEFIREFIHKLDLDIMLCTLTNQEYIKENYDWLKPLQISCK